MTRKKNSSIFTISFNPNIPRHALAVDTLNVLGRKKAEFLAALIEAAAKHPEAFGLICEKAGNDKNGDHFEGEMNDRDFLISMMEGTGFKRTNQPRGQGGIKRPHVCNPSEKEEFTSEENILLKEHNKTKGDHDISPKYSTNEQIQDSIPPDTIDDIDFGNGEIPEELRESFFSNIQYFEELGDDEEYDDF